MLRLRFTCALNLVGKVPVHLGHGSILGRKINRAQPTAQCQWGLIGLGVLGEKEVLDGISCRVKEGDLFQMW